MKKPILLFHGNCPDGFASFFAFHKRFGDEIDYLPVIHSPKRFFGLSKEMLLNRKIYMADICFERKDLIYLSKQAEVVVEDHHLTAQEKCGDLPCCHFDMGHSGAILAWKYCFPDKEPPLLLKYIEVRDLWKWDTMPYAHTILAAVDSYEKTLENWDLLMKKIEDPHLVPELLIEGEAILRYNNILMKGIANATYMTTIKGHHVPIINTPFFRSELLNQLAKEHPFAAGYHMSEDGVYLFSLRSSADNPDHVNVAEIAGLFPGGGGHKHASGFSIKDLKELK